MLLTDTLAPEQPAGQIWVWALVVSVVALLAVSVYTAIQLRRARAQTEHETALLEGVRAENAHLRAEADSLRAALDDRERTTRAVATDTFPRVTQRVREGASAETVLAELGRQGRPDPATHQLTEVMTRSLWRGHQQRRRLLSIVRGCAARARAGVAHLRAEVQERSLPYWSSLDTTQTGERVREDLMAVEAGLSRLEMLIQRLLTVAEADRIGRNWTRPLRIERVVRAAIGSVPDFSRVRLHSPASPVVVDGRAVNAIMQVTAELVDNATSFSAPSEAVVVHFESTAMRLGVHIDDSGLAMTEEQLAEVRRRLDPARRPDIAELSANQLGLLVVRRSADPLGVQVDIGPSPRGGTRATIWIPRNGLLRTDEAAVRAALPTPAGSVTTNEEPPFHRSSAVGPSDLGTVPETPAPAVPAPEPAPAPEQAPATAEEGAVEQPGGERPAQLPRRRRGATISPEAASPRSIEPPRDRAATSHRITQWHAHTRPAPPAEKREDT